MLFLFIGVHSRGWRSSSFLSKWKSSCNVPTKHIWDQDKPCWRLQEGNKCGVWFGSFHEFGFGNSCGKKSYNWLEEYWLILHIYLGESGCCSAICRLWRIRGGWRGSWSRWCSVSPWRIQCEQWWRGGWSRGRCCCSIPAWSWRPSSKAKL